MIIETTEKNTIDIPVLPLRGLVVFPKMMLHFDVGRKKSIQAINDAMSHDQLIFLCTQKDASNNEPSVEDVFSIGVLAKIVQVLKQPDNMVRVVVEGQKRAKIINFVQTQPYIISEIMQIQESNKPVTARDLALVRSIKSVFERYIELTPKLPSDILFKIGLTNNPGELADYIAGNILLDYRTKQTILEENKVTDRLETLLDILTNEVYLMEIENEINQKAREKIDKSQKEYFLREQMRVIQEELGEDDDPYAEADEYRRKIYKLNIDKSVEDILIKECTKLEKMPFGSHEATVIRTYLDTCIDLPWNKSTKEQIDLIKVEKALDKNHYGLEKVKERIIEQLAVKKLAPDSKGQIICLVGPPGVGKTSIAQSIAKAINRKSQRIALGGVKDEAEIRGHRKTYIGSMPGRIITAIKQAKSNNPLLILDEVDKLSSDFKGDPTSALLEVLDSEQNNTFQDHYLDIPFDLSRVMFITTANDYSAIPAPLRDRMDVIELDSYTREEKFNIAKKHLLPRQVKNCGLSLKSFKITDDALYLLIDCYTKEAGVRSLERTIASLIRKSAKKYANNEIKTIKIKESDVEKMLGPKKFLPDDFSDIDEIGVANGLAWTSVGGEILPIEVAVMNGTGKIELTGSLGDVMQESAKAAITCIRSYAQSLKINSDFYKTYDIHIHAPEGAVPKDGPSAGITMATAVYSALSSKPIKHNVAMTGEITLRGRVLPIGGLKEKSMAAYKAGIKTVIIPKRNISDLEEVDSVVKSAINFVPVDNIKEVLAVAISNIPIISDLSFNTSTIINQDVIDTNIHTTAQ